MPYPALVTASRQHPVDQWATGRLLSTAARLVEQAWDAHLATWGLTHAGFAALWMVESAPMSQGQLAAATGVQDQTMSKLLDRLERQGHVERVRSATDRRRVVVSATDTGRRAVREISADAAYAEQLVGDAVPDLSRFRADLLAVIEHHGGSGTPGAPT